MKMNVLRKMEYKEYRIYIMQFSNVFQYLITDDKKNLYQDHLIFPLSFTRKIGFTLGLCPRYSEDEIKTGEEIVLSGAIRSIDALIEGLTKEEKEMREVSRAANSRKSWKAPDRFKKKKCMWRAVTGDDGELAFQCLNHPDIIQKVPEGEQPFHKIEAEYECGKCATKFEGNDGKCPKCAESKQDDAQDSEQDEAK